jgi:hypothetical protein
MRRAPSCRDPYKRHSAFRETHAAVDEAFCDGSGRHEINPLQVAKVRRKNTHAFRQADLFARRLQPNPRRPSAGFVRVATAVTRRWLEVRVEKGGA